MANEEHLARLKQGVGTWNQLPDTEYFPRLQQGVVAWNQWRAAHRDIMPDLARADLTNTALCGAELFNANLTGANLRGADLTRARIGETIFGDSDLSMVRRLDTIEYTGPSSIGIDTLYRSHGNIPEVFLRGAGVPDEFITYVKSLVGRPFEFYSCFISYNHTDQSFARRLHDQLQGRGIRCWLDEHKLLPGDDIYEQIDRGIRFWDKVLLCCSRPR